MKGFVFTLDAIFSLIFAAFAVAALIYVSYTGYTPPGVQSSQAVSLGSGMVATSLSQLIQSDPLYGAGSSYGWPQYGSDEGFSFGSAYGPGGPYLLYDFRAPAGIIPAPVASDGYVAFAAGNQVYELDAAAGVLAPDYPVTNHDTISAPPLYYRNSLIYANSTGYMTAVSEADGNDILWRTNVGYAKITSPPEVEDGYIVLGASNSSGGGRIYLIAPGNGSVMENYPTSSAGIGANVIWTAHHRGAFYMGVEPGRALNSTLDGEFINASLYPSNSFASYGSFAAVRSSATASMYGNLTAFYSKATGKLNLTSVPAQQYAHSTAFALPPAAFNSTPSIGGNVTYLLSNGTNFYAFSQGGQIFNVTLPGPAFTGYRYSDTALAYGNAYVAAGNVLYAFGVGALQQGSSLLAALGSLYLEGRGGLANYALYSRYGSDKIGIFIDGNYGPALHVSKFNGFDSNISVPSVPRLSPEAGASGAMSLCGWYRINNLTGYNGLLFKGGGGLSPGTAEYAVDPEGVSQGFAVYNSALGSTTESYSAPLAANSVGIWYSFCLTYNATAARYYLNGTSHMAAPGSGIAVAGGGPLVIGGGVNGLSNVSVADIQLYNSVLPASRIESIYYDGPFGWPQNKSGLVGWWPLLGDGNDYGGGGLVGFPGNMTFIPTGYAGPGGGAEVGSSGMPIQLTYYGFTNLYNVSVAIWSG